MKSLPRFGSKTCFLFLLLFMYSCVESDDGEMTESADYSLLTGFEKPISKSDAKDLVEAYRNNLPANLTLGTFGSIELLNKAISNLSKNGINIDDSTKYDVMIYYARVNKKAANYHITKIKKLSQPKQLEIARNYCGSTTTPLTPSCIDLLKRNILMNTLTSIAHLTYDGIPITETQANFQDYIFDLGTICPPVCPPDPY